MGRKNVEDEDLRSLIGLAGSFGGKPTAQEAAAHRRKKRFKKLKNPSGAVKGAMASMSAADSHKKK